MRVDEQRMLSVSKDLWNSQLGLTVRPGSGGAEDEEPNEKTLASCVKISGAWQGAILVECTESIARHAAVMLFADDGENDEQDLEAAIKELADMFGKRIRPFLPEETKLSRPALVVDEDSCKALAGMQGLSELKLSCEGRPVRVVLFQSEPDLAAAG